MSHEHWEDAGNHKKTQKRRIFVHVLTVVDKLTQKAEINENALNANQNG